jgi:integrase
MGRLSVSLVNKARNGKCAPGRYRDGANGLMLSVSKGGAASWLLRYQLHGRRRDAGLGSVHHVGLAKARELAAAKVGALKADRVDPLEARTTARAEQRQRSATFDDMAAAYIKAHSPSWKNRKHAAQWSTTLAKHASPVIGRLPAAEVTTEHILKILQPIWHETPDTASRLRARIELVLDYARAQGFRREDSANPARWRGHLQTLLPAIGKLKTTKHHAAVEVDGAPAVYAALCQVDTVAALALRFCLLTASRPSEAINATWSEVDMAGRCWNLDPKRHKSGKYHRVPLADEAVAVLRLAQARRINNDPRVFAPKFGKAVAISSLLATLRKAGGDEAITSHGSSRSTFDDFSTEPMHHPEAVVDWSLGHGPKGKTRQAYRRADRFAERVFVMRDWAAHLTGAGKGDRQSK